MYILLQNVSRKASKFTDFPFVIIFIIIRSSGFGIVLQAESTELHVTHCAEKCSMSGTDSQGVVLPQDIGHSTAMALIEQIVQVCFYDYNYQLE